MFKDEFLNSLNHHTTDIAQQSSFWKEIEKNYSGSGRHYHTLVHLDNLLKELLPYRSQFQNWNTLIFALAYHDIVYNTLKSNNEEKSADLAVKRLQSISYPPQQITQCKRLILATKSHEIAEEEINLFTDADLSILGSSSGSYQNYAAQIRREYSLYPDLVYNPGRKKVLAHFLQMEQIFKTRHFANLYEHQARLNIKQELVQLS